MYLFLSGHLHIRQCADRHFVAVGGHQADLMFHVVSTVAEQVTNRFVIDLEEGNLDFVLRTETGNGSVETGGLVCQ